MVLAKTSSAVSQSVLLCLILIALPTAPAYAQSDPAAAQAAPAAAPLPAVPAPAATEQPTSLIPTRWHLNDPARPWAIRASAELGMLAVVSHTIQYSTDGSVFDFVREGGQSGLFPFARLSAELERAEVRPEARDVLASDFKFLGAFRLPNNAFAANAGTEVVTDVIFLQKLRPDEPRDRDASWLDVNGKITVDGQDIRVNRYYQDNPTHILGRSATDGTMYGGRTPEEGGQGEYTVHGDGRDLGQAIDNLITGGFAGMAGIMERNGSDMSAALSAPFAAYMTNRLDLLAPCAAMGLIVLWRHRENVARLDAALAR